MKKFTLVLAGCAALAALLPGRVLAIWAPSTSLQEKQSPPTPEQVRQTLQKVQDDERRIEEALTDLKKDEDQLKLMLGEGETAR